jgi:phage terminase large subunit GpA-like protein
LFKLLEPVEYVAPAAWQERHRVAPPGSPKPGPWRNYPYQVEVFDSFNDPEVSSLCLMWASQFLGKTSIIEGGLMWMIDQNPGTAVCVFPTQANAVHWSKNRFGKQIADCTGIGHLIKSGSTRRYRNLGLGGNTILHKSFPGGWMVMGGANSPAGLAAHTARWQIFEEVDRYPESSGDEGDVIILTQQRGAKFADSFTVTTSTPTLADMSRIEKELAGTDARKWHVKCPECANWFVILWHHIKWPKAENEAGDRVHLVEDAYLECPSCLCHHDEAARVAMVVAGKWVPSRPWIRGKRGYWANAFLVLGPVKRGFKSWMHYFGQRFLDAERLGVEGRKTFSNLILAETFQLETTPPPDHTALYARRETYPEFEGEVVVPDRVCLLTVGADVQNDRIECEILGFGPSEETWGIAYRVFRGDTELPDIFAQFDQWALKKWRHGSGHWIWPAAVAIDSSNKPTQPYAYVLRTRREYVYAVKGRRGYRSHWVQRSGASKPLMILDIDGPKERLYSQLKLVEYGPGYQHFPSNPSAGYDLEYFRQLTAEKMVRGQTAPYFVRMLHRPNEALDARIYALAAREFLPGVNYSKIQANFNLRAENDWRGRPEDATNPETQPRPAEPSMVPANQRTPLPTSKKPKIRREATGWGRAY